MNIVPNQEVGEYLPLSDFNVSRFTLHVELLGLKIGNSWRSDIDEALHRIRTELA